MKLLAVLLLHLFLQATSVEGIRENNKAIESLKEKKVYQAKKSFLQALSEDPLDPVLRFNLGLSFQLADEHEKALKEYKVVLQQLQHAPKEQQQVAELKFITHFNRALAYTKMQNIPKALVEYQAALELKPDAKEVKTNIELLWQNQSGGGQGQQKKDDKQDKQQQKQQQQPGPPKEEKKQKPKKFKSKELNKDDVRKILEEIKNQEQKIRAKEFDKKPKQPPKGKDW